MKHAVSSSMGRKRIFFSLIELLAASVAGLIVLLPLAGMMGGILRDWRTNQELKEMQFELDSAAYSVKGIIEEAYGYEIESESHISLFNAQGVKTVEIFAEGSNLVIRRHPGNGPRQHTVTTSLKNIVFVPDSNIINVSIGVERGISERKHDGSLTFDVFLRNYR